MKRTSRFLFLSLRKLFLHKLNSLGILLTFLILRHTPHHTRRRNLRIGAKCGQKRLCIFRRHGNKQAARGFGAKIYAVPAVIMPTATVPPAMIAGEVVAGLSGAALTSASLAVVGGGSLAAGGLGIAGGTAIITGGGALLGMHW